jgi:hypothetical protein
MNTQQDLAAAAFPMLDDAQMATLARCMGASLKTYATGQTPIRVGERDFDLRRSRSSTRPGRRRGCLRC